MSRHILMLALLPVTATTAMAEVNQEMIDRVAAAEITEARASWWGFDAEDSTKALQAAIDSGAQKLIVEDMSSPWIVRPITLASNQEIIFEEGCEILAKRGEFKGRGDSLFTARDVENITLRGYGATFRMWREDYDDPDLYEHGEWRHCLSLRGAANVNVFGLTLTESGGDGIYLGIGEEGATNRNVHIRDVVCDANYRQGISVITAENLLIEDTIMRNTSGTPPMAGIDFEPNKPTERLVNVTMRNCLTEGNSSWGYLCALNNLNADSEPLSMRFENCRSIGDAAEAVRVITDGSVTSAVGGTVEFVDCELREAGRAGIRVSKPAAQGVVRFERCSIIDCGQAAPSPIEFRSALDAEDPVGGVDFEDVRVKDLRPRDPMVYLDMRGLPLESVTGSLILVADDGEETRVDLTVEQLAEWMSLDGMREVPYVSIEGRQFRPMPPAATDSAPHWPWFRQEGTHVIHAAAGDEVTFRARFGQVGNYSGEQMPVKVTAPSGQVVHEAQVPFQDEATIRFTAPATGLYRVAADPRKNRAMLSDSSHPMAILGTGDRIHFMQHGGRLQFWVPRGTELFAVRVSGDRAEEALKAALIDPTGEIVDEVDNQFVAHQFDVELEEPSPGEAWTLQTAQPSVLPWEDFYVEVRGVPPLLVPAGAPLLAPVEN